MEQRASWSCVWHHHAALDNNVAEGKLGRHRGEAEGTACVYVFVGVCRGSEAGVMAKISGMCVCDKSKAGTDGQKQNIACRHTMRRSGGALKMNASHHYCCLAWSTWGPSTIEAATHWESRKQESKKDAPFGRDTKMISPHTAPQASGLPQSKHWGI